MEVEKNVYYISLDKKSVSKESVADTMEYEVYATPEDIVKFEGLLQSNDDKDFVFALKSIPFKPFAEKEVDEMREETDDNLMEAYEFIYTFGTEKTREKLKEIGYDR